MALNYETLIRAASKSPEQRTSTEISDVIFPWLKHSLSKKQGLFQKISDDVIHDICRTTTLERRQPWDVVIRQNDPGETFYIILQGAVNIYRLDDDHSNPIEIPFDLLTKLPQLDDDPDQRESLIIQTFGNYVVTLLSGFDFGERALVTNEPRSATVMTCMPTDLLVIDREVFSRTLKTAHERELQEKTEFINRCPFFSSWSARLKRLVSLSLERQRFPYDSILFKQGTPADAVYFIWNGEVKLSLDPLMHWLQYPQLLPTSDPMRQHALNAFLPMFRSSQLMNHYSSAVDSFVIKRRQMTFAEAEKQRNHRTLHLALLNAGDIIGLEPYVCDLSTHINTARCTAPSDLFYILKHNFQRLQKRHGTQGLGERLREMVLLSFQAYPTRILQLPLYNSMTKRYLNSKANNEQSYHNKQTWLLQQPSKTNKPNTNSRRNQLTLTASARNKHFSLSNSSQRPSSMKNKAAAYQYLSRDQVHVNKLEDRLKRWHVQFDEPPTRPLTRYNLARATGSAFSRSSSRDLLDLRSDSTGLVSSMSNSDESSTTPVNLLLEAASQSSDSLIDAQISIFGVKPAVLPQVRAYTKKEQYDDLRAYLKQAWKEFNRRPIPNFY